MAPFAALEVNRLLEKGKTTSCLADLISLKADFQVNPKSHDWHFYFFTKGIRVFLRRPQGTNNQGISECTASGVDLHKEPQHDQTPGRHYRAG